MRRIIIIIITCTCMGRHGFPGIFVAMVLREASALMRISSNYYYLAHAQRMRRSVTDI